MLRENKLGIVSNLILVMLMSCSISQTLYTSLFMSKNLSMMIFIAVVPLTLLFYVMFRSKITAIVSAIVVCISLIVGLSYILLKIGISNAEHWLSSYFTWFIDVGNGYYDASSNLIYKYVTILSIALIITLFIFIFSIKFYNFYVICILLFSVFFVQLQFDVFSSNFSFVLFIFSFLLYYFFDILRRRSKEISYNVGNKLKYLLYIIPVCVLVIAISFLFPIKSNRIELPKLDNKIDSTIQNILDLISGESILGDEYFSINSTGFGKQSRLGGNINLSKTHVMNVKSEYSNLYLRASSKPFYDGHGWYDDDNQFVFLGNKLNEYSDKINSDSNEFLQGSLMITKIKANDSISMPAKAEIEFTNLKTKSLFMPLKSNLLTFKNPQTLFYDNEQMISTSELQKKGFSYTVQYNSMMFNSDEFKNIIRKSHKGYYTDKIESYSQDKPKELKFSSSVQNGVTYISSDTPESFLYEKQANDIYNKYTQLPDVVTPRVRQLAQELTKDKANTYDKAKAVETYLSNNYPYTLTPGNPPRKKDFVDYFLFEGKKGYCTYYASAMTVLLRCIDIPARYVEGYILPPENKDGIFKVTNQQAHAWVEVYFEGFGWIPFESTSPFVANMYNDKNVSATISSNMINAGYDDYLEMMNRYRNEKSDISYDLGDINNNASETNNPLLILIIISSVLCLILLAFCILATINVIKYYRIIRKIRKSEPNAAVIIAYTYILKVLKLQNIVFEAGETPSEFGERVEKTLDFKSYSFNKTSFTKITNYYTSARYSQAILLNKAQLDMLEFIIVLLQLTNEKVGKLKFNISRYFWGKI